MNAKYLLLPATLVLGLIILLNFVQAPKPWMAVAIGLPSEIEMDAGDTVVVNGTLLNVGWYWLHNFNISVSGLPKGSELNVTPSWFEHVRILREWNPERGVYLVPEVFQLTIKVPEDASGVFLVNVTGKEWRSWRQYSNSSAFILKVLPTEPPRISLTDIVVPETVVPSEKFNISFEVKNEGVTSQMVTLKVIAPQDWVVEPAEQKMVVQANSSAPVVFTLTPTETSGEISIFMEYPFRKEVLNMTKTGPFIIPSAALAPAEFEMPTAMAELLNFMKANVFITIIAAILLLIIFWNIWQIAKHYKLKSRRGKPEEMVEHTKTANHLLENFG